MVKKPCPINGCPPVVSTARTKWGNLWCHQEKPLTIGRTTCEWGIRNDLSDGKPVIIHLYGAATPLDCVMTNLMAGTPYLVHSFVEKEPSDIAKETISNRSPQNILQCGQGLVSDDSCKL